MIIQVRSAALTYQSADGEVEALRDISLAMDEGEMCSIVGPSGCGKSTLLGAIAGLEQLDSGSIVVDGEEVRGPSPRIGLMPQRDQLFEWKTILENVMLGLQVRQQDTPEHRTQVLSLLERYGLADFAQKRPSQLSGGMRQRCALIRTLAIQPRILLLDEPFSSLDLSLKTRLWELLARLWEREKPTTVLVTHDLEEAWALGHTIVVLKGGKIVYETRPSRTEFPAKYGEQSPQKQALLNVLIGE